MSEKKVPYQIQDKPAPASAYMPTFEAAAKKSCPPTRHRDTLERERPCGTRAATTSVTGQEFHRRGKLLPIGDRRDQADDRHHDQEREPLLVRRATHRGPRSSTT
jgi:hypothetical protein